MNQHWFIIVISQCQFLIQIVLVFTCSPLSVPGYIIFLLCFPRFLLTVTISRLWWPWQMGGVLAQDFIGWPSTGISLMFPMIGVIGVEEEDHRSKMPFSSHRIRGIYYQGLTTVHIGLYLLAGWGSGCQISLPFQKAVTPCSSHLRSGESCSASMRRAKWSFPSMPTTCF